MPVAISVLSRADLARYNTTSLAQVAAQTPSLIVGNTAGPTGGVINLRGIGSATSAATIEQAVSINLDGTMSTALLPVDERKFPPGTRFVLLVLIVAKVTVSPDFSLASIAPPSIERGLGLVPAVSQWIITSDILAYAGILIIAGRLADIFGQKRTLTVGLTTFLAGTLLASMSSNVSMLIVARILQGIGGAFTYPSAFSLLTISFRGGPQRFRAYTTNMAAASAGVPLVTMFVGWPVTRVGGQSAFLFNVPLCLIVLTGLRFVKPPAHVPPSARTAASVVSALLLTTGIAGLIYALTGFVAMRPGAAHNNAVALGAGLAILMVFGLKERGSKAPLIPYGLFRLRNFAAGILCVAVVVMTGKALILLFNISLQRGLGFTPSAASLTLLPMILSSLMVVPMSARLDRILLPHAKWVDCGAFAITGLFYLVLSQMDRRAVVNWKYAHQSDSQALFAAPGEAAMKIETAWLHVRRVCGLMDGVAQVRPVMQLEKVCAQAACGFGMRLVREAANALMDIAGPAALTTSNPVQRLLARHQRRYAP